MRTFGEEVKRLADAKGMTQKELADACGLSQPYVSQVMNGVRGGVGADVLFRLSDALGVPVEHFRPFLAPKEEE